MTLTDSCLETQVCLLSAVAFLHSKNIIHRPAWNFRRTRSCKGAGFPAVSVPPYTRL